MVMIKTSVADAKAKLSEFLDRAVSGERIVICRHNKPIAELRGYDDAPARPRPIGPLPGRPTFEVPSSFFEPLPDDELEAWEGGAPLALSPRPLVAQGGFHVAEGKTASRRDRRPTARRRRS